MIRTGVRLQDSVKAFFTWWRGELEALLPARFLALLQPAAEELTLEFTTGELAIRHSVRQAEHELGRIPIDLSKSLGLSDADIDKIEHLVRELSLARVQVKVLLPASQALRRVLTLPAAAEKDLRQALGFEMDRLTPFSAEEAYFDFAVIERDRQAKQVGVEFVVLPRSVVERALDIVAECGLTPDVVDIAWGGAPTQRSRNFLAEADTPKKLRVGNVVNLVLAALAIVLLASVVYVPLMVKRNHLAEIEQRVDQAMIEAKAGKILQEKIDELGEQYAYIYKKKINQPEFIDILHEVTKILPDNTWLFRLRYVNGELQIFGNSITASVLIGLMEKSPLFESVVFRAPVTRDQRVDAERFHIAANVVEEVEP